jgi:hypothetical protein
MKSPLTGEWLPAIQVGSLAGYDHLGGSGARHDGYETS